MSNHAPQGWRTTDEHEIEKRRQRASTEQIQITNLDTRHPIFSNFEVVASSGRVHRVEVRDLAARQASCTCVDFRTNGLGTCKHVEAVLAHLKASHRLLYGVAESAGSPRIDIVADVPRGTLAIERNASALPGRVRSLFGQDARLTAISPEEAFRILSRAGIADLRLSQDLIPWFEERRRLAERRQLRREYEGRVQSGEWPPFETLQPLFPYQREGMLHLAFTERAILADEMGLGKSVQAIAACALLQRLGKAQRAVVLAPRALLSEWEEHFKRFTHLAAALLPGSSAQKGLFEDPPFFTLIAHEKMNERTARALQELKPDILVLDDAHRIRNWNEPLAQAFKHLSTRYAFVLTGSPVHEQIERLFLLMDFVNPEVLGPLFRFNRDYYQLDADGRPVAPRNLEQLYQRVRPFILRRRKEDVEHELPELVFRNYEIQFPEEQARLHAADLAHLRSLLRKAPEEERDRIKALAREVVRLANGAETGEHESSKLAELETLLMECRDNAEFRIVIFADWEDSLSQIADVCARVGLDTAPLPKRLRRKGAGDVRVFLCAGVPPANQVLETVHALIHFDVPLDKESHGRRLASVWRKGSPHLMSVIYFTTKGTIEPALLEEFRETADFPNLLPQDDYESWAGRLLRLLPEAPADSEGEVQEEARREQQKLALVTDLACSLFGKELARIEEVGNPYEPTRRRLILVLKHSAPEDLDECLEQAAGMKVIAIDLATYSAGQELVRKEILPPPMFPPRVLYQGE